MLKKVGRAGSLLFARLQVFFNEERGQLTGDPRH